MARYIKRYPHVVTDFLIGLYLYECLHRFCAFVFVFVFVIDDNNTQADEAHIMCLKTSNENKSSHDIICIPCSSKTKS
jgi:hypothetical protein